MKRTQLLFFLILLRTIFFAQSPGYMGKKVIVGYGIYLSPITFGSNAKNQSLFGMDGGSSETGYLRFNVTQEVFFEGVLSKKLSLGLAFKHLRSGYDNRARVWNYSANPSGYYVINAFTLSAYFKKYMGKYIAPWGSYFIFGPVLTQMRSKHDAYMNIVGQASYTHDTLYTDFGSDKVPQYRGDVLLGFGKNRILFDRLSVDYGFCIQAISALVLFEAAVPDLIGSPPRSAEYIERTMKKRVRGANRFNAFLKIGYLF